VAAEAVILEITILLTFNALPLDTALDNWDARETVNNAAVDLAVIVATFTILGAAI
jgi:hypothetical protein